MKPRPPPSPRRWSGLFISARDDRCSSCSLVCGPGRTFKRCHVGPVHQMRVGYNGPGLFRVKEAFMRTILRLYRKRRREAMRYVRIPLHVMEVDALIRIDRLKEDSRTDAEVLQAAVLSLLYQALGESEIGREMLRYV